MSVRWEEIEPGREPAALTVGPITRTDFVRYQGASGDMNPIHHDEVFARASGFQAPLGVGMFPAGVMSTWATDWLGPESCRGIRIRWKRPVWPGDTLTFSGAVAGKREEGGQRLVELELKGVNQDNAVVVLGWMTFVVPV